MQNGRWRPLASREELLPYERYPGCHVKGLFLENNTADGQKGYSCPPMPPLFLYAEEMNGQIIKVPVSLFNLANIKNRELWKSDFTAEFRREKTPDIFPVATKTAPLKIM